MPSSTVKQRTFMRAELGRARAGEQTRTGMSEEKLEHFAKGPIRPSRHIAHARARRKR